jgi:TonB-dependent starch-binding outer membrane protein SusC
VLKRVLATLTMLAAVGAMGSEVAAQQREIRGTVTTVQGAPLAGVSVQVFGTMTGTITAANGVFTIAVPGGDARLRVSMIGYKTQDVPVPAGQSAVTVRLAEDVLNLEALVVTGQATTTARRNLANAVATVGAQELERVPAQTVDKALQGKIAGANIQTNSGAPGGGVQVTLRGVSSINGASEPLWVVDGVIVSNVAISSGANAVTRASAGSNASNQDGPVNRIADINPADIERIEVLKGASAAAIYGSKASNGVILVTTKRGSAGAPRINVTQRFGQYRLSNTLGMRQWTRNEAVAAFGLSPAQADQYFDASGMPRNVVDHERSLAGRSDLSSETSFSISGGTDDTRYYVSGLWQNDAGVIENTGFRKHSLRLNLDQRLSERVSLVVNSNLLNTLGRRGLTNNDNTGTSFWMVFPFTPNFIDLRQRPDGTFPINPFERSNPFQTAALMQNDEDVWRLVGSGNLTVDLMSSPAHSLRLLMTGGADYFQQKNELFFPPELQFEPLDQLPGTAMLGNSDNLNLNWNANLVHSFAPAGGGYTATTSAGIQFEDRDLTTSRTVARYMIGGQRGINAGAVPPEVFQQRQRVRDFGFYLQEEVLLLQDRLMVTGSIRGDRSSAAGDPERFHYYPKASVSYRLPGLLAQIDELKLRAAYGETGNQPLFGQKFVSLNATNNIQGLPGIVVFPIAGDPDIRPERTREIETGIDLELFSGRGTFELTYYDQQITDLLLQRTVAPSTGFTSQFFNGGGMKTTGIEMALAVQPIVTPALRWFSRTTFAANRSEITDLPVDPFRTGGFGTALGAFQIEAGKSATQIVANVVEDGRVVVRPVGDANPDFRMGFANEVGYGAFSLYGLLDWQQGGNVINLTKLLFDFGQNTADYADDPQPGVHPVTGEPLLNPDGSRRTTTKGERRTMGFGSETRPYIEDASFLKLREVTLSYALPHAMVGRIPGGVNNAQLSLSGRNLLTFTRYTGLDPEVSNFGNQSIARNIDVAPYPPSRSFWLSINVGF